MFWNSFIKEKNINLLRREDNICSQQNIKTSAGSLGYSIFIITLPLLFNWFILSSCFGYSSIFSIFPSLALCILKISWPSSVEIWQIPVLMEWSILGHCPMWQLWTNDSACYCISVKYCRPIFSPWIYFLSP